MTQKVSRTPEENHSFGWISCCLSACSFVGTSWDQFLNHSQKFEVWRITKALQSAGFRGLFVVNSKDSLEHVSIKKVQKALEEWELWLQLRDEGEAWH